MCDKCENIELLVTGIRKSLSDDEKSLVNKYEVVTLFSCDLTSQSCCSEVCRNCPAPTELLQIIEEKYEIICYQWQSGSEANKYPEKKEVFLSGEEAKDLLLQQVKELKLHLFTKNHQHEQFKLLKENLKDNEIIIHVDFSENYDNKQQNTTQSACFGYQSFSLYTVCIYYNEKGIVKVEMLVLVTPTTEHNPKITWCLNKFLLCHFNRSYDTVYFWSDGCAVQFKSKFTFHNLTFFPADIKIHWHYHHCKGAVDGPGGCVKNTVYCHVKAWKTVLGNPKQFAEYANSIITNIDILYVRDDDLLYDINKENVKAVPGTLKVRHIERKITGNIAELLFYTLSNTCNTFLC